MAVRVSQGLTTQILRQRNVVNQCEVVTCDPAADVASNYAVYDGHLLFRHGTFAAPKTLRRTPYSDNIEQVFSNVGPLCRAGKFDRRHVTFAGVALDGIADPAGAKQDREARGRFVAMKTGTTSVAASRADVARIPIGALVVWVEHEVSDMALLGTSPDYRVPRLAKYDEKVHSSTQIIGMMLNPPPQGADEAVILLLPHAQMYRRLGVSLAGFNITDATTNLELYEQVAAENANINVILDSIGAADIRENFKDGIGDMVRQCDKAIEQTKTLEAENNDVMGETEQLERKLAEAKNEVASREEAISNLRKENDEIRAELELMKTRATNAANASQKQIESLETTINSMMTGGDDVVRLREEYDDARERVERLTNELESTQEELREIKRTARGSGDAGLRGTSKDHERLIDELTREMDELKRDKLTQSAELEDTRRRINELVTDNGDLMAKIRTLKKEKGIQEDDDDGTASDDSTGTVVDESDTAHLIPVQKKKKKGKKKRR